MRTPFSFLAVAALASVAFTGSTYAGPKTYQVTGPVLAVTPDTVTVQKGTDKWELGRSASTKITGELKVGAKVTIEYTMDAVTAEVKGDKPAAAPDKKDAKDAKKKK